MRRWYLSSALFAAFLFALWLPTHLPTPAPLPQNLGYLPLPSSNTTLFVLDTSGSMKEEGDVVADYLSHWQGSGQVGLITYSDSARLLVPPTASPKARQALLGSLNWRGGSNMYAGIETALDWFREHHTGGRILLVSDGSINVGQVHPSVVMDLGREAQRMGVVIDVLQIDSSLNFVLDNLASQSSGAVLKMDAAQGLTE